MSHLEIIRFSFPLIPVLNRRNFSDIQLVVPYEIKMVFSGDRLPVLDKAFNNLRAHEGKTQSWDELS